MLDLIISTLTQGFIYALLSFGVYITYKILDFPDLTVDGSFPLGAAVTAVLLVKGVNPYLALLISFLVGYYNNDGFIFNKSADSRFKSFNRA